MNIVAATDAGERFADGDVSYRMYRSNFLKQEDQNYDEYITSNGRWAANFPKIGYDIGTTGMTRVSL